MKTIERLSLIDKIGRELQSRMSYGDIKTYLRDFGVDSSKETSGVNSKWVYTKELLSDAPADTVLRIADELGIPHGHTITPAREITESVFWEVGHFRLFLSHLSIFKGTAANLQSSLRCYGISAFVAHVDIEPTKEWQDEIEAALYSMDALVAILMPGFKESNWTDQEVGIAIGRGVLVIPIMRGLTPYGFIGKYQGLDARGKTVAQVAWAVFEILITSPKTKSRMLSCLVDTAVQAASKKEFLEKLIILDSVEDLPAAHLERLREGILHSRILAESEDVLTMVNELLAKRGLEKILSSTATAAEVVQDNDIPF